jgi:predicted DNA-binding transcriptional regulator YafY
LLGYPLPTTGKRCNLDPNAHVGVSVNQIILSAVRERLRIRFWYDSEFRTVEPHCFGRDANGALSLIGFQLGSNAWRLFHVPWMTRVSTVSETFTPRSDYARDEHGMAEVLAQV